MSRIVHCCLDVQGALKGLMRGRGKRGTWFVHEDGRHCTREEEIDILLGELAAGRKVIPFVKVGGQPCEGFSYETGCPGHETEDANA